jgi:hypothetical protein
MSITKSGTIETAIEYLMSSSDTRHMGVAVRDGILKLEGTSKAPNKKDGADPDFLEWFNNFLLSESGNSYDHLREAFAAGRKAERNGSALTDELPFGGWKSNEADTK